MQKKYSLMLLRAGRWRGGGAPVPADQAARRDRWGPRGVRAVVSRLVLIHLSS